MPRRTIALTELRSLAERAAEVDGVTLDALNDFLKRQRPEAMSVVTLGAEALTPPADTAMAAEA